MPELELELPSDSRCSVGAMKSRDFSAKLSSVTAPLVAWWLDEAVVLSGVISTRSLAMFKLDMLPGSVNKTDGGNARQNER